MKVPSIYCRFPKAFTVYWNESFIRKCLNNSLIILQWQFHGFKAQCPQMTSKLNNTEAENYIRSNRVWSHTSTSSWDSSLVICRLLGFTGRVVACLVKSPRSKSVASRSLTAVSHSHLSDLTVHQQAGSHNRQQSKREVTYQNILSEQRLRVIFFTRL